MVVFFEEDHNILFLFDLHCIIYLFVINDCDCLLNSFLGFLFCSVLVEVPKVKFILVVIILASGSELVNSCLKRPLSCGGGGGSE